MQRIRWQVGQTTAEYALVLLAAAVVAIALYTWARETSALAAFFDAVIQKIKDLVPG